MPCGRSSGRRGDTRLSAVLGDIDVVLDDIRTDIDGRPLFLYGHSLGGLVSLLYGLDRRPALDGIVVTGAALPTTLREQRLKMRIAGLLGRWLPVLAIPSGLDDTKLNRDPAVLAAYRADPLVHDRATLGFALDALEAIDRVLAEASQFPLPLLVIHGSGDEINRLSGSEEIARMVPGDVTIKVYDGVYHAVEHEPESEQIIDDVISWLDAHRHIPA